MIFEENEIEYMESIAATANDLIAAKKSLGRSEEFHMVIPAKDLKLLIGRERLTTGFLKNVCSYFTARHNVEAEVNTANNDIYLKFSYGKKSLTLQEARDLLAAKNQASDGSTGKDVTLDQVNDPAVLRKMVNDLWSLLDDIDSASDAHKPDNHIMESAYFKTVTRKVRERMKVLESDGYSLFMPGTLTTMSPMEIAEHEEA
jgi:hypothetical protein